MTDKDTVTGNRDELNRLIFEQNLDEVHLLIDFISGRANRSLDALAIPGNSFGNDGTGTTPPSSREIIERITNMRYPPEDKPKTEIAEDAAILLMAKDSLSRLADPARGLTIAYTAMFVGDETDRWWVKRRKLRRHADAQKIRRDTRVDLAESSFPSLKDHAHLFRRWRDYLVSFSIVWLFFTAVAYWDAGLARSSLERLDQDWKIILDESNVDPSLHPCEIVFRRATQDQKQYILAPERTNACRTHWYHREMADGAKDDVHHIFECSDRKWTWYIHIWCWPWNLGSDHGDVRASTPMATQAQDGHAQQEAKPNNQDQISNFPPPDTYWQPATSRLSVFTTYILPMMFAVLGTLIRIFRVVIDRVRENLLAPRYFGRLLLSVPLGLIAGVAVGLFLSPSSLPAQGSGGIGGQLSLTASGLGFLAGYASYNLYNYLDVIVSKIFPGAITEPLKTDRSVGNQRPPVIASTQSSRSAPARSDPAQETNSERETPKN